MMWLAGEPIQPTRQLLQQQPDLSAVGGILAGLLNNNTGAAASAIAAAANSGNTAAITSAISFAGLAVSLYRRDCSCDSCQESQMTHMHDFA